MSVVISDLMTSRHEHVSLDGGSFALISGLPNPCRAVVFVHGWGGSPAATWHRFQELVDDEEGEAEVWAWWQEADLYFFSYESRRFSISEHAERFLRFLDQVFPLRLISPWTTLHAFGGWKSMQPSQRWSPFGVS